MAPPRRYFFAEAASPAADETVAEFSAAVAPRRREANAYRSRNPHRQGVNLEKIAALDRGR
jgi:hypothetical protein